MPRMSGGSAGTSSGGGGGSVTQGTTPWVDNITQIGGVTFSLGQQLAASSLPVVLTAAQISTLTPLSTVAATQSGNWTTRIVGNVGGVFDAVTAAGVPANALQIGIRDDAGLLRAPLSHKAALNNYANTDGTSVLAAGIFAGNKDSGVARIDFWDNTTGDANASATFNLPVNNFGRLYNNSTYDRIRSIINSTDSIGTGIQAVGITAQFDDTSPSTVTENQFGNVRMNSARQLYTQPVKLDNYAASVAFTCTLASLANSTAGVGRQSNLITSNTFQSALIACKVTVGTSPTANTLIYVYLIRGDGTINDDNAGSSDAGITIVNAPLLGTILCSAVTSNVAYYGVFDTKFLGSLGPSFGVAFVNSTGATLNATGGNHVVEYTLIK